MSSTRGRTSAFVLGLIAGIINFIIGIIILIAMIAGGSFIMDTDIGYMLGDIGMGFIGIGIIIFIVMLINLIGGSVVKANRIAGGVLMMLTGLPLFVLMLIGTIQAAEVASYWGGSISFWPILLLIIEFMSVIAAIIAFVPPPVRVYNAPYGQPYQQPYQQPPYQQPPYQQPVQPQYQQPQYQQPVQPQYQQPPAQPPQPAPPPPAAPEAPATAAPETPVPPVPPKAD